MAITKEEIDLQELFRDLGKICKTEAVCQKCADRACLVGYAKDCAAQCRIKKQTYVAEGFQEIPEIDIRGGYDEYDVLHGIAHILLQCRSCKKDHYEDCILNVIRSCMEIIEFGDNQVYEGDVLSYLMKMKSLHEEKASIIASEYSEAKEKRLSSN
ncbi:MAG: hypothetical protein PHX08_10425 [Lachnospiraceae bacterium]|nr:hypothetical protein [Lachnospiraceae bacterium]